MFSNTFHVRLTGPESIREDRSIMLNCVKEVLYLRFEQDDLVSKVDFLDGLLKFDTYVTLDEVKTLLRNMGMRPGVDVDITINM